MRKTDNRFVELEELLSKLHDSVASEMELRRIESILTGDPEACEFYLDYSELCAQVDIECGARQPVEISGASVPLQISQSTSLFFRGQSTKQILTTSWRPLPWLALAAVLLIFAGSFAFFFNKRGSIGPTEIQAREAEIATHNGVAILMESVGAKFVDNGMQPSKTNGVLYPGQILLESGIAAIEFYSGARVILEGPTIIELTSQNSAILLEGRLRSQIPPHACGFSVLTPQVEAINLGTEFGISIEEDGHLTEVHCFDGVVDIYENSDKLNPTSLRQLKTGEAIQIQANGLRMKEANPISFISYSELARSSLENSTMRHERWRELIEEIRADEDILALYTFEEQGPRERSLVNQVSYQGLFSHGAIVGCRWTNGRWPSKGSLEFKSPSDRIHLQSTESHQTVTFAAWIRIDALPHRQSCLLSSTEQLSNSVEWMLTKEGKIMLGVRTNNAKQINRYTSPATINRNMLGKWHHLATVFNSYENKVTHFLDAVKISTHKLPKNAALFVTIANSEIGNSSAKIGNGKIPFRHLIGRIDEFAVFGRALDHNTLEQMYRIGRPH